MMLVVGGRGGGGGGVIGIYLHHQSHWAFFLLSVKDIKDSREAVSLPA